MSHIDSMPRGLYIVLWLVASFVVVLYAPAQYIHGSAAPKDLVSRTKISQEKTRIGATKQQGESRVAGLRRNAMSEAAQEDPQSVADEASRKAKKNPLLLGFALGTLTAIAVGTQMGQRVEAVEMPQTPVSPQVSRMLGGSAWDVDLGLAKARAENYEPLSRFAEEKRMAALSRSDPLPYMMPELRLYQPDYFRDGSNGLQDEVGGLSLPQQASLAALCAVAGVSIARGLQAAERPEKVEVIEEPVMEVAQVVAPPVPQVVLPPQQTLVTGHLYETKDSDGNWWLVKIVAFNGNGSYKTALLRDWSTLDNVWADNCREAQKQPVSVPMSAPQPLYKRGRSSALFN